MPDYTNEELMRLVWEWGTAGDYEKVCNLYHPTDSVYIDPFFGEFRGQDAIRKWLVTMMSQAQSGDNPVKYSAHSVGEATVVGDTGFREWFYRLEQPDGTREETWGCSVKRFRDGWIVYAADYQDTHQIHEGLAARGVTHEQAASVYR